MYLSYVFMQQLYVSYVYMYTLEWWKVFFLFFVFSLQVLGTPTREQIREMNPNYTEFKFPQIKAHPWTKVSKQVQVNSFLTSSTAIFHFQPSTQLIVLAPFQPYHPSVSRRVHISRVYFTLCYSFTFLFLPVPLIKKGNPSEDSCRQAIHISRIFGAHFRY